MSGILSNVTPPLTTQLTTLAAARLDIGVTDNKSDTIITSLIDRASGIITRWLGGPLGLQSQTETFRLNLPHVQSRFLASLHLTHHDRAVEPLLLTYVPIVAITSIVAGEDTLQAGIDYECDPQAGLVWRLNDGHVTNWHATLIVIDYQSGYVLPQDDGIRTLSYDIEEVCLSLIKAGFYARASDPNVTMELTEGVGRTVYAARGKTAMALDDGMFAILAQYRRTVY